MKKSLKYVLTGGGVLLIIGFMYLLYLSATVRQGEIVEDSSMLELACKMRPLCVSTLMSYRCDEKYDLPDLDIKEAYTKKQISLGTFRLLEWEDYYGCNESTKGFVPDHHIEIKGCSCRGFFG